MKKLALLFFAVLLLAGCGKTTVLNENYDNMKIGKDGINSYLLDFRIYGVLDAERVDDIMRITVVGDDYEIIDANSEDITEEGEEVSIERDTTYVKDGKVYTLNSKERYVENKKAVKYTHPQLILETLKNVKEIDKGKKTTVGENKYTLYKVTFKKAAVAKIIEDTSLKGMKLTSDVKGEVYIDSKGYVYKIMYTIDDVTINASYFGINATSEIYFPSEIK